MKRITLIGLLGVLASFTLLHFDLIRESIVSVGGTALLLIGGGDARVIDWDPSLTEFRVAAVVWVGLLMVLGVVLIRRVWRTSVSPVGSRPSPNAAGPIRSGVLLVSAMGFVSMTCPFLVPFSPEVQGDLTTTRLRPPLSTGTATVLLRTPDPTPAGLSGLSGRVSEANNYLRHRKFLVTAGAVPSNQMKESAYQVIHSFPVLFVCGTDDAGRDIYSRVIYGTRISFGIGLFATLGAMILGLLIGVSAGMSGSTTGMLLMRFTDLMLSIPGVFIIIGFMAFVSQSAPAIILVLALTGWMHTARIVRNETLSLREREFVLAARMLRIPTFRIILRHLLPNMSHIISTAVVLQFANAVLGEATLGFLGLGIQPPTASWGNMIGEGTAYLGSAWWIGVFPGLVLAIVLIYAHRAAENMEFGTLVHLSFPGTATARIRSSAQ
jgi:peptide/nickel transport system permease protein